MNFREELVNGDPFEVASEIKRKSESVANSVEFYNATAELHFRKLIQFCCLWH